MCGAVLDKRLHAFPSLDNVLIIQLPEIHNVTPQLNNFSRGIILPYKSIFAFTPKSILFLGKDCSHSLALPLKEKGKSFSLTDEGVTPRLLSMGLPGVPEDRRPTDRSRG